MKSVTLAFASLILAAAASAGEGPAALINGTFEGDGLGGVLDWGFGRTSSVRAKATKLDEKSPDGTPALRIVGGPGEFVYQHSALKLVAGEPYRLSAWVRTKGLASVASRCFEVWNYGWSKSAIAELPADTDGEWRKIEWTGPMVPSQNGIWSCAFYFSGFPEDGYADVASPSVEPLSDKARQLSTTATPRGKPFKARILPIDPLIADVDAAEGRLMFYYPGDLDGKPAGFELVGSLGNGRTARSVLGDDRRATLRFGAIDPGRHDLTVKIVEKASGRVLAENAYPIRARRREVFATTGRRLNNFVTELFTVPLKDGRHEFVNPRDGWVFIGFSRPCRDVCAYLDQNGSPVVRFRPHERSETMRYLAAGTHTVTVRGADASREAPGGTLSVRLVKPIQHSGGRLRVATTDIPGYSWGAPFYRRFLFPFFNETFRETKGRPVPPEIARIDEEIVERGIRITEEYGIGPQDTVRNDLDALCARIRSWPAHKAGLNLCVDENGIGVSRLMHHNFAEACWRTLGPEQTMGVFFNDATSSGFIDPAAHTEELSAILNSGDCTAQLSPEVYLRVPETEEDAYAQEDYFLNWVESARALVPSAPSHVVYYLGGWLSQGQWSPYYCPEGDVKVLYDHFLHRLATDPKFADVGGAGFSNPSCDECILRWSARLLHYYCIEGGTELRSEKFGFRYRPGLVRNGEFFDGFDGWTVEAAEPGSVKVDSIRGFGKKGMKRCFSNRIKPSHPWGDSFALFTRSDKGPNVLRQRISGLEEGRTYEFMFCTIDHDDALGLKDPPKSYVFGARVEGAEELKGLAYEHASRMLASDRKAGKRLPTVVTHRIVFRAKGPSAEIVFSDWKDAKTPGEADGRRRMLNFIAMWPYYEGRPGDLEALEEMMSDKPKDFVLAERGRPADCPIAVRTPAAPSAGLAARELADYVRQLTGVTLPVVTDAVPEGRAVCLSVVDDAALGPDGFRLKVEGERLSVTGGKRGVLYGVYEILETFGGVNWWTSWCRDVPRLGRLAVPRTLDDVQVPAFAMRQPTWKDNRVPGAGRHWRLNSPSQHLTAEEGDDDFRFVSGLPNCHTTLLMIPPKTYYKDHPEYFSEIDGRRRDGKTQLCLTNPDVFELVVSNVLDRIAKDPKARYYGIAQMDWANYCECPKCKAVDDEEESHMGTQLRFANAVAERVEKVWPDKICETIAYEYTQKPPKLVRPRKNVMICLSSVYCDFSKSYAESRYPKNAEFLRDLKAWSKLTDNLYVWDYNTNFRHYLMPFANIPALQADLKILRDHHVHSVYAQGAYQGWHGDMAELKNYLAAKWLWNPDLDRETLVVRFLKGYYGAAAPYVKEYLDRLHALPRDEEKAPLKIFQLRADEKVIQPEFLDWALGKWAQAEAAVKGDPVRSYNVRMSALAVAYWRALGGKMLSFRDVSADAGIAALAKRVLAGFDEAKAAGRPIRIAEHDAECEPVLRQLKAMAEGGFGEPVAGGGRRFGACVFTRGHDGFHQALVKDAAAVGGEAVKLFNTESNWYTTWKLAAIDFGSGRRYRLRVKARAALTGVAGEAFSIGVHDAVRDRGHVSRSVKSDEIGADYAWYDVGEWTPGANDLLWVMAGSFDKKKLRTSPVHDGIWIGGLEIVPVGKAE